ncbi:hypothetical protein AKO1_005689 [Acrasis kona]|uniref:Uncharacterized protein n=1 Tax=Acrasis kona TaxID=1008807 RepID=A0AAW2YHP0_9EUKA
MVSKKNDDRDEKKEHDTQTKKNSNKTDASGVLKQKKKKKRSRKLTRFQEQSETDLKDIQFQLISKQCELETKLKFEELYPDLKREDEQKKIELEVNFSLRENTKSENSDFVVEKPSPNVTINIDSIVRTIGRYVDSNDPKSIDKIDISSEGLQEYRSTCSQKLLTEMNKIENIMRDLMQLSNEDDTAKEEQNVNNLWKRVQSKSQLCMADSQCVRYFGADVLQKQKIDLKRTRPLCELIKN